MGDCCRASTTRARWEKPSKTPSRCTRKGGKGPLFMSLALTATPETERDKLLAHWFDTTRYFGDPWARSASRRTRVSKGGLRVTQYINTSSRASN
jgi:hypothetical protein